tara:strand:+ start:412 stop:675 length:264 start_codon:yes stop_codon:yes gene_type:complete
MDRSSLFVWKLVLFEAILPIILLFVIAYINMEYIRIILFISCSTWIIINMEGVLYNVYLSLSDFPLNQAMFGPPRETFDNQLETKDD